VFRRFRPIAALALAALAGCGAEAAPVSVEGLRTMSDAARAAERSLGVPGDLVLALAWTETRWQLAGEDSGAHEAHVPRTAGVAAIRPGALAWATAALGVDAARIDSDPSVGVLAAAVVLRGLAARRYGGALPAADDPAAWHEVIADYVELDDAHARAAYAASVLDVLRAGLSADAADGTRIVIRARPVAETRTLGVAREYSGAEYPSALWVPASTSNYTPGRGGRSIRYIVIHTAQGSYSGTISWFRNPSARVSAHYVIRSSDGEITQMVREGDTAWHAGNWDYNQQSIGIEHEGFVSDPARWYTTAMYESSARLVRYLCDKYGIPIDRSRIIGHYEVPGATHTDPGSGWDWERFMRLVRGEPERPAYAAVLTGLSHPAELTSGERAVAWVEYRNEGSATWRVDRTRLGTTDPDDHPSPFYDVENWINDHRATGADHSGYGTGSIGRFSFMITAPEVSEETTVSDTFRLVEEGVTWFGDPVRISVLVRPRPAPLPPDADGDGTPAGEDCDDGDAAVHPGAVDLCGDGIDADCDGNDPECAPPSVDGGPAAPALRPTGGSDGGVGRPHLEGCAVTFAGGRKAPSGAQGALAALALALALARRRRRRRRRVGPVGGRPRVPTERCSLGTGGR
jgi:MYXO-CTERM domain-containing protein